MRTCILGLGSDLPVHQLLKVTKDTPSFSASFVWVSPVVCLITCNFFITFMRRRLSNFIKFDSLLRMNVIKKLQVIKQTTGLTQTKLAEKLGVSFVTFNSWWTGKSLPRPRIQVLIDELFLEVTGQKKLVDEDLYPG